MSRLPPADVAWIALLLALVALVFSLVALLT